MWSGRTRGLGANGTGAFEQRRRDVAVFHTGNDTDGSRYGS